MLTRGRQWRIALGTLAWKSRSHSALFTDSERQFAIGRAVVDECQWLAGRLQGRTHERVASNAAVRECHWNAIEPCRLFGFGWLVVEQCQRSPTDAGNDLARLFAIIIVVVLVRDRESCAFGTVVVDGEWTAREHVSMCRYVQASLGGVDRKPNVEIERVDKLECR